MLPDLPEGDEIMTKNSSPLSREDRRRERRKIFLEAASEVFLEQGFAGTSLDAIIQRTGGSRRTIYTEFGNKQGLYNTLVEELTSRILEELEPRGKTGQSLHEILSLFSKKYMDVMMSPTIMGLSLSAMAEGLRFPDLSKKYFESGPRKAQKNLAAILRDACERGEAEIANCDFAAEHLMGMIRGDLYLQVLLRVRPVPDAKEREAFLASALGIFMKGIRKTK